MNSPKSTPTPSQSNNEASTRLSNAFTAAKRRLNSAFSAADDSTERARKSGGVIVETMKNGLRPSAPQSSVYHHNYGVPQKVREAVARYSAPLTVLDLDAFRANAKDMVTRSNGTPIRVSSKSLRMKNAIKEALAQPGFSGVQAYSLQEAIWLVKDGVSDDVLVGTPSTDKDALHEIANDEHLARAITLTADSPEHLNFLDSVTDPENRHELRICLDIDAALVIGRGMYIPGLSSGEATKLWTTQPSDKDFSIRIGALRSPIHGIRDAQSFVKEIWGRKNMKVVGILAFESQISDEGDAGTGVRPTMRRIMQSLSRGEIASRRQEIVNGVDFALMSAGLDQLEFVNGGGTGSLESTGTESTVTEIAAGSGLIGPGLLDHFRSFQPHPACWFVLPVIRRPGKGIIVVAGGGRVASGTPSHDKLPVIDFPTELEFAPREGAGEVQTALIGPASDGLAIGDKVWLRHAKAGEAMEWTNSVLVVSGGEVVDTWTTYRGEGFAF
ncbi:amino acid deaminase/aldolase [Corynebacterium kroppenstedtii]